ncbi:MAG: polyprenyl synthetase family protein [Flavisolibacter sp.]
MNSSSIQQQFLSRLAMYRDESLEHLVSSLPDREPKKYLYDLVTMYPSRGGKGFRPSLCLSVSKIFGGNDGDAMNTAIALEIYHNAFLIHDDIEDESEDRRGLPTMHSQFGIPIAINVGDAMNVLTMKPLMQNLFSLGPQLAWQIFTDIEHMVLETVEGQAMELGWRRDNNCKLQDEDYMQMILKKTCWYTCIHPIRLGAIIGSKGKINADMFNRFGYYLGAAFQIQDDLLNLEGEKEKYGKEIGGDILEGKRTLMLIHLLNTCNSKEKKEMEKYLLLPRAKRTAEKTALVMDWMLKYDCLTYGKNAAKNLAGAALKEFYTIFGGFPDIEEKQFLENMILYMINRDK